MNAPIAEKIFHPTAEKLQFLLASIDNKEMALPGFQRDFVWEPSATEELIESICQHFPAGSLLRIKNSSSAFFAPREFAGAPSLNNHKPSYLILNGQQRMTSLYQAFYGVGTHRYFIEIGSLKATNIRIGKRAPSDYLREIERALGGDFGKLLSSHLLPADSQSPLLKDNFEEFLNHREGFLGQKIREVTS
jgi:uncharacterized protein with ParB-like and HNH nuclease domain